jgi:tetratricopeptide (TPR) repeat protein
MATRSALDEPPTVRSLHGRGRELAELDAALEQAFGGRGGVFLLSGEAGIGKTRLAEELAARAEARGVGVFWGRAWEVAGAPACWPWTQVALTATQTEAGADFLARDPSAVGLASILAPARSSEHADDPELGTARLALAMLALLQHLAAEAPVVLVLDDLHAADVATLTLLGQIARDLRRLAVLVIGTYREVEARRSPRIAALLVRVARDGTARSLARLDHDAVSGWLAASLGNRASAELGAAIFQASEGNPLFVDALVQLVAARGDAVALPSGFVLPDTIQETVRELLERVSPPARAILEATAVLGRECQTAILLVVSGAAHEDVLAAVAEGVAAGVLAPQVTPLRPVRFAHVLIREVIYRGTNAARRIELHARCLAALRRIHGVDLDAHLAELAHHAFESASVGSWADAVDLSFRAGLRALDLLAFDDAARHFERTLAALDHGERRDDALRADVLWRLGRCQIFLGQPPLGRETCERAAACAEAAGRADIFARAALASSPEVFPGRADHRLGALLERALAMPGHDAVLQIQLAARLASALVPTLAPERPMQLAREAIAAACEVGDRKLLAAVLATVRFVFMPAAALTERLDYERMLFGLVGTLGDPILEAQARGRLAMCAIESADPDATAHELRLQRDIADRLRLPWHQLRGACIRLLWSSLRGDDEGVAAAEHIIRDHIERVDEVRSLIFVEANRKVRAEARGDERTAADARTHLESLLALDPFGSWCLPVLRAAALAHGGRKDDARTVFLQYAPEGPAAALRAMGPALLLDVAPFVLDLGDAGWMQEVYEVLLPFEGRNSVNLVLLTSDGPIAYHLGLLARALGRADDAARHFAAALAMCERAGFTACAARTRAALGTRPRLPDASASAGPPELRRRGDVWILRHGGRELLLADSKGVCYLAALLEEPGRERHVLELVGEGGEGDAGPHLDAETKANYRRRLDALRDALEDAEERGDRERATRLEGEREAIAAELARAVGLGGRNRRAGAASERARINVQRRLRDVLDRVAELDAALGRHLDLHVKTGVFCSYRP